MQPALPLEFSGRGELKAGLRLRQGESYEPEPVTWESADRIPGADGRSGERTELESRFSK